jgi:hypothetical protein
LDDEHAPGVKTSLRDDGAFCDPLRDGRLTAELDDEEHRDGDRAAAGMASSGDTNRRC